MGGGRGGRGSEEVVGGGEGGEERVEEELVEASRLEDRSKGKSTLDLASIMTE